MTQLGVGSHTDLELSMSETLTLPVLPLDDGVVLPGMVVPLDLSESGEVRAAIEAARAVAQTKGPGIRSAAKPRVLLRLRCRRRPCARCELPGGRCARIRCAARVAAETWRSRQS